VGERDDDFVVFPDLSPDLPPEISPYLLVSIVGHVSCAVSKHFRVESTHHRSREATVISVALRECFVNEKIVIIRISSKELLLSDHLHLFDFID
jgi:hypothetical protein